MSDFRAGFVDILRFYVGRAKYDTPHSPSCTAGIVVGSFVAVAPIGGVVALCFWIF